MNLNYLTEKDLKLFLFINDVKISKNTDLKNEANELLKQPTIRYTIKMLALDRFLDFPKIDTLLLDPKEVLNIPKKELQILCNKYHIDYTDKYSKYVLLEIFKFHGNIIEKPEYKNRIVTYKYDDKSDENNRGFTQYIDNNEKKIINCCKEALLYKYRGDRIINNQLRENYITPIGYTLYRKMTSSLNKMVETRKMYTTNIYRGFKNTSTFNVFNLIPGTLFQDKGFASFSTEYRIADEFADIDGFIIVIKKIPPLIKLLYFGEKSDELLDEEFKDMVSEEYEVVLPPYTTYKIINVNLKLIEMEIISSEVPPYIENNVDHDSDEFYDKILKIIDIKDTFYLEFIDEGFYEIVNNLDDIVKFKNDMPNELYIKTIIYKSLRNIYLTIDFNLKDVYGTKDIMYNNMNLEEILHANLIRSMEPILYIYDIEDYKPEFKHKKPKHIKCEEVNIPVFYNLYIFFYLSFKHAGLLKNKEDFYSLIFKYGSVELLLSDIDLSNKDNIRHSWLKIEMKKFKGHHKAFCFKLIDGTYNTCIFNKIRIKNIL